MNTIPEEFRPYINDYPVHILPVRKLENTEMFQTDLRQVFDSIRYSDDKEKFQQNVLHNPAFEDISDDAFEVIQQYIHSKELEGLREKRQDKEERRSTNMCRAITELIADGKSEGKAEGKARTLIENIETLAQSAGGMEQACRLLRRTQEEYEEALALVGALA